MSRFVIETQSPPDSRGCQHFVVRCPGEARMLFGLIARQVAHWEDQGHEVEVIDRFSHTRAERDLDDRAHSYDPESERAESEPF